MTDKAPKKSQVAKRKPVVRRVGSEKSATRMAILRATEKLMREEGYAAVSSRRVAKEIDVKASLIHYYFPSTDDLFLALYRQMLVEKADEQMDESAVVDDPLALWQRYHSHARNALVLEFMALANHRKLIRDEIVCNTELIRRRRAELLNQLIDTDALAALGSDTQGLSVLLIGVARTLVMEESLGVTAGHQGARSLIEKLLGSLSR